MLRILLFGLICLSSTKGFTIDRFPAKTESSPIFKYNILSPAVGTFSFQLEIPSDAHRSRQYGLFIFTGDVAGINIPAFGLGLTYDYRFYMEHEDETGLYVQPYARAQLYYTNLQFSNSRFVSSNIPSETPLMVGGFGLVIGYQWIVFKRMVMDIYGGPMYNIPSAPSFVPKQDLPPYLSGYWYRAGVTIGFKFN